jgi:hypothetical protein
MAKRTSPRSRQRGVGLIEVSLALTIGIVLMGAATVAVKKNSDRAQSMELAAEESLIFSAADAYYRSACRTGTLPTSVTTATLLSGGYLPRSPRSPWGATWSVTYLGSPRRAQVSAVLTSAPAGQVTWIGAYASAYTYTGNTVYWIHNIRIAADTTSASALEFKAMYETSNC